MYERYLRSVKGWQMAGWAIVAGAGLWQWLRGNGVECQVAALSSGGAALVVSVVFLINPKARAWAEENPPEIGGALGVIGSALKKGKTP